MTTDESAQSNDTYSEAGQYAAWLCTGQTICVIFYLYSLYAKWYKVK
jgi:hypothetical protein